MSGPWASRWEARRRWWWLRSISAGRSVSRISTGSNLSNLNRLGAGCDDLGLNKALIVARRISKIDPYLKVEVYEEGVTESRVDRFLDGLDLLLEECDAIAMKWKVRERARERAINVVFARR